VTCKTCLYWIELYTYHGDSQGYCEYARPILGLCKLYKPREKEEDSNV
jgi:hypothetical protein